MNSAQEILLKKYAQAVTEAPQHFHLTSIHDQQIFWDRHIADAVKTLEIIPSLYKADNIHVLDVGTGNGIPGIPFSIFKSNWKIDLLDSDNKKALFIDTFIRNNAINNVRMIQDRAEIKAHSDMRAAYDIVIARALSKLRVTLELCAGFVRTGGILIVPHGTSWKEELGTDLGLLGLLGFDSPEALSYRLESNDFFLLLFKKISPTPEKYPRRDGMPKKRPL